MVLVTDVTETERYREEAERLVAQVERMAAANRELLAANDALTGAAICHHDLDPARASADEHAGILQQEYRSRHRQKRRRDGHGEGSGMSAGRTDRPWPTPSRPGVMAMQWHDLLFMHWPLPVSVLRPLIPPGLTLDTFDGCAWIGVVPFTMAGVHARYLPPLPGTSTFPELNVRTYVTTEGKAGVYFFSLDAANPLAVRAARLGFRLPYYDADMSASRSDLTVAYASTRTHHGAPPAAFAARYRPTGPVSRSTDGSIDAWLTERYCLYSAAGKQAVWRADIDHTRWPLQPAEAEIACNTMVDPLRLVLPDTPPLLHFARQLDVMAWRPRVVDAVV